MDISKTGFGKKVGKKSLLEKAFGGVLRRFTLGGSDLHDDSDQREITILTDDERPFVQYGEPKKSVTKRNKIDD